MPTLQNVTVTETYGSQQNTKKMYSINEAGHS